MKFKALIVKNVTRGLIFINLLQKISTFSKNN